MCFAKFHTKQVKQNTKKKKQKKTNSIWNCVIVIGTSTLYLYTCKFKNIYRCTHTYICILHCIVCTSKHTHIYNLEQYTIDSFTCIFKYLST